MKILIIAILFYPLVLVAGTKPLANNITLEIGKVNMEVANFGGSNKADADSNFVFGLIYERLLKRRGNFQPLINLKAAYTKFNNPVSPYFLEDVYRVNGQFAFGTRYFAHRKLALVPTLNYEYFYELKISGNTLTLEPSEISYGSLGFDILIANFGDSFYSAYVGGLMGPDDLTGSEIMLRLFRKRQTYSLFKKAFKYESDETEQDVSKFGFSYGYAF